MNLIFAAIAPAILLLIIFYKIDYRNPEPILFLLKLYIIGMLCVIPILIVEWILMDLNMFALLDSDLTNAYNAFAVAGFTEEIFKWAVVFVFAYRNLAYDEPLDGIIYCVFVGLGFATIENVFYVIEGSYSVAFLRAILSVPAHMLFGVSMGYYFSVSKFLVPQRFKFIYLLKALLVPILLHGLYDYILMSRYTLLLIAFIPYVLWMWSTNLKRLKLMIHARVDQ